MPHLTTGSFKVAKWQLYTQEMKLTISKLTATLNPALGNTLVKMTIGRLVFDWSDWQIVRRMFLPVAPSITGFWKLLKSGNAVSWVNSGWSQMVRPCWVGLTLLLPQLLLAVLQSPLVKQPGPNSCVSADAIAEAGTLCERHFFAAGFDSGLGVCGTQPDFQYWCVKYAWVALLRWCRFVCLDAAPFSSYSLTFDTLVKIRRWRILSWRFSALGVFYGKPTFQVAATTRFANPKQFASIFLLYLGRRLTHFYSKIDWLFSTINNQFQNETSRKLHERKLSFFQCNFAHFSSSIPFRDTNFQTCIETFWFLENLCFGWLCKWFYFLGLLYLVVCMGNIVSLVSHDTVLSIASFGSPEAFVSAPCPRSAAGSSSATAAAFRGAYSPPCHQAAPHLQVLSEINRQKISGVVPFEWLSPFVDTLLGVSEPTKQFRDR